MPTLRDHALTTPGKPAMVFSSGVTVTYAQLDARANRLLHLLHARGLQMGDHIAIYMENNPRFMDAVWAALRAGLYVTPINWHLPAEDSAYIANDCGAKAILSSYACGESAAKLPSLVPSCRIWLMADGIVEGWEPYETAADHFPAEPLPDERMGELMLYSSGTTGRPKGVVRPLSGLSTLDGFKQRLSLDPFRQTPDSVYLSPAPLYHAAPIGTVVNLQARGGTSVIMDKFDAEGALRLIERYRVTHSQWVPTMFVRLLRLPEEVRRRYDLSSQRVAVHAAAPCPVHIKRQMIDWWGPILFEYYGGSEGIGFTAITSEEWLVHPGSVGRPFKNKVHICDDDGESLPLGEVGLVYFEQERASFSYHGDDAKTREGRHPLHANWATFGDIGCLDADGYLYLTDRKAFMIISGGVNVYPQAIEDVLIQHPSVSDVAVFGVPDEEMGESVKAVVEPRAGVASGAELAEELTAFARARLAGYMVPRSIDFIDQMPRLPTGKLYKRVLRDKYWPKSAATSPADDGQAPSQVRI
jgi:fatty-acyl-CoA synthase